MRIRLISVVGSVAMLLIVGCGGEQKTAETGRNAPSTQSAAYPLDWCIVSGEKLGAMGDPVSRTYQGRAVTFCCKFCIEEFEKQPGLYLTRIDSAAAGHLKPPPHDDHGAGG